MWSTKRMQATRFSRVTSRLRDVTRRRVTSALSRGNYKSWHMHVISEVVCGWEKLFFGHWVESCSHRHWCCRSRCCSVVSDVTPVAGHWHATSWLKHSISSSVSLSSYYVLTCVATVLLFGVQPSDSSTPSRFRFSLLTVQYMCVCCVRECTLSLVDLLLLLVLRCLNLKLAHPFPKQEVQTISTTHGVAYF